MCAGNVFHWKLVARRTGREAGDTQDSLESLLLLGFSSTRIFGAHGQRELSMCTVVSHFLFVNCTHRYLNIQVARVAVKILEIGRRTANSRAIEPIRRGTLGNRRLAKTRQFVSVTRATGSGSSFLRSFTFCRLTRERFAEVASEIAVAK